MRTAATVAHGLALATRGEPTAEDFDALAPTPEAARRLQEAHQIQKALKTPHAPRGRSWDQADEADDVAQYGIDW